MKILIIQTLSDKYEKLLRHVKSSLEKGNTDWTVEIWKPVKIQTAPEYIKKVQADIVVNFNLAGFELCTLTEGIAYNLLNSKQIHILLQDRLSNESFLSKQLSISMFFYCTDFQYYQHLSEKYPDMPYLKCIRDWDAEGDRLKNAGILCNIIRDVAEICAGTGGSDIRKISYVQWERE